MTDTTTHSHTFDMILIQFNEQDMWYKTSTEIIKFAQDLFRDLATNYDKATMLDIVDVNDAITYIESIKGYSLIYPKPVLKASRLLDWHFKDLSTSEMREQYASWLNEFISKGILNITPEKVLETTCEIPGWILDNSEVLEHLGDYCPTKVIFINDLQNGSNEVELNIKDIKDNWDNYRKEFTDDENAKHEDYEEAIIEYAEKLNHE